jgi:tRNA A37 threonylcarbamoyladenosine synthetase subunit TsaC/SUA5/YrdC
MFITGKPLYPVERTLLTTGTLAFLFDSRMAKKRLMTPQLSIAYRAPQHAYFQKA